VHVKSLELSYFKSFGNTTTIPLLPGFTVVSGPNGSGKSNLLDAMLFALGLSGSKGMRAERLPDLVNQAQLKRGHAIIETKVTVTFDISDVNPDELEPREPHPSADLSESESGEAEVVEIDPAAAQEWQVTRKLRVTKQGTYTSTYAINGEPCTLSELHDQMNRLRIYPEGYNVVLQGDVTGIISMNARQRREIIDELAGVANFDRKINQAREKLDAVKEQEDRFHIVEQELKEQCDRLDRDRVKAQKYQLLRAELQDKSIWENVLAYRSLQQQIEKLSLQIQSEAQQQTQLETQIQAIATEIQEMSAHLAELNAQVKALGEDEQLAVQAAIATQEAELRQLQRQQTDLKAAQQASSDRIGQLQQQIVQDQQQIEALGQQGQTLEAETLKTLIQQRDTAKSDLENLRERSRAIATSADAWVQEQTQLRNAIETLLTTLDPNRSEFARLQERAEQLERQSELQREEVQALAQEISEKQIQLTEAQADLEARQTHVQNLAAAFAAADETQRTEQETLARLQREQREKQRQLDQLEAKDQAQQEAQGTFATKLLLKANLPGICGLVANLGRVEPQYQIALETAAGARIGHLVVDNDEVAAAGIELLKRERGGRATFLPLNKLRNAQDLPPLNLDGAIDYAAFLVEFDAKYDSVFAYVFGNTVVFESLSAARRYIGRYRMVTLDGDLLEPTGAMTGGSRAAQQSLHFGHSETGESAEILSLRQRLGEIEQLLGRIEAKIALHQQSQSGQDLTLARQQHRDVQFQVEQLTKELQGLTQRHSQLTQQQTAQTQELTLAKTRLATLEAELPQQESELAKLRAAIAQLEQSQTHSEWQQIQTHIQNQETLLQERETALRTAQQQLQDLSLQGQRLQEKIQQTQSTIERCQQDQINAQQQEAAAAQQQEQITVQIADLRVQLQKLEAHLGEAKQNRDRAEQQLQSRTTKQQELTWQVQKLIETQQEHQEQIALLQTQRQEKAQELPDPLPELPETLTLEALREDLRSLQRRIQAMEPVNMLAIEEFERTQARLQELMEKLATLEEERTELLLRIENFTTLRQKSFKEAFDTVNESFQTIFASLSDGDGYLELEDAEDPFRGGMNLVAHPKGKPVQRLASMSGGEKSLTALSFIFALQRYRPSPFYALDEVDSFLDGVNVERLAKTIRQQAENAQFIVVSHRRPMIEAADRTIGVTQARGTHTQVIGMQLRPS
jgi:chromosome segregation protein